MHVKWLDLNYSAQHKWVHLSKTSFLLQNLSKNSAIMSLLDDMLGLFGDINVPISLLDQLPKKNVKMNQQNKISLSNW